MILITWDMMQHYWVSDFQNLKGMLEIIYPAMHCHTPEDRNLKMNHCENLKLKRSSNATNPHTAVRCRHSAITFCGTPLLLTRNCRIIWVSSSELMFWLPRRSTISRLVLEWSISSAALPPVSPTPQFCRSNATNNHISTITITNNAYCQVWGGSSEYDTVQTGNHVLTTLQSHKTTD